jgi:prepilin-type N-terminal cleavage/methylation domain-containing protein
MFLSHKSREIHGKCRQGGFSLIEVLASAAVLSVATLGITSVWRLADDKALAARLDERAMRILAEYAELQNFAPQYQFEQSRPSSGTGFEDQGLPLNSGELRTGFLYHPRHVDPTGLSSTSTLFDDAVPYQLALITDGQGQLVRLTYQRPFSNAKARVVKQIRLNLRQ